MVGGGGHCYKLGALWGKQEDTQWGCSTPQAWGIWQLEGLFQRPGGWGGLLTELGSDWVLCWGPHASPWVPQSPGSESVLVATIPSPGREASPAQGPGDWAAGGGPGEQRPLHLPPSQEGPTLVAAGWTPPFPTVQGTGLAGSLPHAYPAAHPGTASMSDGKEWGVSPHGAQGSGALLSGSQQRLGLCLGLCSG